MPLRIGFLTTLGVNVGDEFIREGIRAVLDRLQIPYHPFYVDKHRFTSLFESFEDEPFSLDDKYWETDVFIQAGAPVYWHLNGGVSTSLTADWNVWIWNDRILGCGDGHPAFINIGAGSCQPWGEDGTTFLNDPACARFARRAAERAAVTIVRDPVAEQILEKLSLPHHALPCPAFLAAARHRPPTVDRELIGINLMPHGGHYQLDPAFDSEAWLESCAKLVRRMRNLGALLFVAHNNGEAEFMSQFLWPGERIFESARWREYLDVYGSCSLVAANRVHGAVCAAGFGAPAIIIGNDTRSSIGDYVGLRRFKAGGDIEPALAAAELLYKNRREEGRRLCDLREATAEAYVKLLEPAFTAIRTARPRKQSLVFDRTGKGPALARYAKTDHSIRVEHLSAIRDALEAYRLEHDAYPASSGGWDGLYTNWGRSSAAWIEGLVPEYLAELPCDPRNNSVPEEQYLYHSDGREYKVIAHNPDDYGSVTAMNPKFGDPARLGWAYGFWTAGAASW